LLAHQHVLIGAAFAGLGVAFFGTGIALLTDRRAFIGAVAVSGLGMAFIGLGATLLADRHALDSMTVIGTAVAVLTGRHVLGYAAVITSGVAAITAGIAWHAEQQALIVAMIIASGAAITGFGTVEIGPSALASGVRRMVDWVTKAPPD
jgi:hypothetical protein